MLIQKMKCTAPFLLLSSLILPNFLFTSSALPTAKVKFYYTWTSVRKILKIIRCVRSTFGFFTSYYTFTFQFPLWLFMSCSQDSLSFTPLEIELVYREISEPKSTLSSSAEMICTGSPLLSSNSCSWELLRSMISEDTFQPSSSWLEISLTCLS